MEEGETYQPTENKGKVSKIGFVFPRSDNCIEHRHGHLQKPRLGESLCSFDYHILQMEAVLEGEEIQDYSMDV
jgi:hypothetical protein